MSLWTLVIAFYFTELYSSDDVENKRKLRYSRVVKDEATIHIFSKVDGSDATDYKPIERSSIEEISRVLSPQMQQVYM